MVKRLWIDSVTRYGGSGSKMRGGVGELMRDLNVTSICILSNVSLL